MTTVPQIKVPIAAAPNPGPAAIANACKKEKTEPATTWLETIHPAAYELAIGQTDEYILTNR